MEEVEEEEVEEGRAREGGRVKRIKNERKWVFVSTVIRERGRKG